MPAPSSCIPKPSSKKLEANAPDGVLTVPSIVTRDPSGKARAAAIEVERPGRPCAGRDGAVTSSPTATSAPTTQ